RPAPASSRAIPTRRPARTSSSSRSRGGALAALVVGAEGLVDDRGERAGGGQRVGVGLPADAHVVGLLAGPRPQGDGHADVGAGRGGRGRPAQARRRPRRRPCPRPGAGRGGPGATAGAWSRRAGPPPATGSETTPGSRGHTVTTMRRRGRGDTAGGPQRMTPA